METIVVCALIASGLLALAFAGDRDIFEDRDAATGTVPQGGLWADYGLNGPEPVVVEIDESGGFPLQINGFDAASDLIELDLDRASFGDVGNSDLRVVPDPAGGAVQLVVGGRVVAVVHDTDVLDPGRVSVFAV